MLDLTTTNRVTLLTPPGIGALAVVRIAGPGVAPFLAEHFTRRAKPGHCVHGELRAGDEVIDDPVVAMAADGSFADISLHGGDWIVRRTVELAIARGFDRSTTIAADEATDAIERDMLASLPAARTELALRILLAQPEAWRALQQTGDRVAMARAIEDVTLHNLLRLPRVAIAGAPNVGKSTLANQLFGSDRSITADLPGTTRDWVGEIADIDGLAVMLVDTPGVRQTTDAIERRAIELASVQTAGADLVVLVIDASQPESTITEMVNAYPDALVVLNKADRRAAASAGVRVDHETVATTGRGVAELRRAIAERFDCVGVDPTIPRCWTASQRETVRRVLNTGDRFAGFD